ncbi:amidohydrolase family protein [Sulfitobacter albidus]|uniref:Amidohydrolase family protein n=1 Tax=Sulfitobacter albidus TaxID=2829501 RepID=A0A975PLK4_9RHOB|nr:amidohydrolase family protein [Sulfitobacter albidus]QUJ75813.1 amidohydrolase family protein [Sulfitobacter albidus]
MPISERDLPGVIAVPRSLLRAPDSFGGTRDGDCQRGAPVLRGGRIAGLTAADGPAPLVIPRLTDPHCHLDKCHTLPRMGPVAGDLATAIEAQLADKQHWTEHDIRTRATQGLTEARAAGVGTLRSHVDWGDQTAPPLSWHVLRDLAQDADDITLTLAPLTNIERMCDPATADAIARKVAAVGGALGAFLMDQPARAEGIAQMFRVAERHGIALDFHVDEGLGDVNGLEMVADAALACGFAGPVLCGHACSLMDRDADAFARIADKLARAGIAVCALPTTNLYLQDRRDGTPDRRGLTRLRELRAAGVRVLTGSDNVNDAFCPMGQFDPMAALHLAALAAHLDPPMGRWLPMITTHAREALGLDPGYVETLPLSELLLSDAADCATLVSGRARLWRLTGAKESRS